MYEIFVTCGKEENENGVWINLAQDVEDIKKDILAYLHKAKDGDTPVWEITHSTLPFEINGFEHLETLAKVADILISYGEDVVTAAYINCENLESLPYIVRNFIGQDLTLECFLESYPEFQVDQSSLNPICYREMIYVFLINWYRNPNELKPK